MPSWLQDEQWLEVTREERQFCADLYSEIRDDPGKLIQFIEEHCAYSKCPQVKRLDSTAKWEVAYEMAYYRDLKHKGWAQGTECSESSHRKFDFGLLSDKQLVIVEAKAQQGFVSGDIDKLNCDVDTIKKSRGDLEIFVVALCSSCWFCSKRRDVSIGSVADYVITWKTLGADLPGVSDRSRQSFKRANEVYGD